ncbi:MAG: hypothetical protein KKG59_04970 [Nanoarchaeota archaeon]|nr:hypothetical protein [Nanoarchaeota archaeon]
MAQESIDCLDIKSNLWKATIAYYAFYYSLYAVMLYIGIKSEIHTCTLLFMSKYLRKHYTQKDVDTIQYAFTLRKDAQYYARAVDTGKITDLAIDFHLKSKDIINGMTQKDINKIRSQFCTQTEAE